MREVLLKKRFGIPAAVLLVLTGVATVCIVATFTHRVTTVEPLSSSFTDGILGISYQGDSDNVTAGRSVSTEQKRGENVNGDSGKWDAWCNIGGLEVKLGFQRESEYVQGQTPKIRKRSSWMELFLFL